MSRNISNQSFFYRKNILFWHFLLVREKKKRKIERETIIGLVLILIGNLSFLRFFSIENLIQCDFFCHECTVSWNWKNLFKTLQKLWVKQIIMNSTQKWWFITIFSCHFNFSYLLTCRVITQAQDHLKIIKIRKLCTSTCGGHNTAKRER